MSAAQIEGRHAVLEALRAGRRVHELLLAEGMRPDPVLDELVREAAERGVGVRTVPRDEIDRRAHTDAPQGVIATADAFRFSSTDDVRRVAAERGEPLLLVALDGVTDPRNVGALARSAEAAGVHGMLLPRRRTASVTPTVEKAAAGALSWLGVVQVDSLANALRHLADDGVWIVALDADVEQDVHDLELATEPLCLVVGAEGRGVSRLVAERADVRCRIPMRGHVDSLNVSVAGAIALFEVARRRASTS